MDERFIEFFNFLVSDDIEGGFSDRKTDPGGRTNYGITQYLLNIVCKKNNVPTFDVKNLTKEQAKKIYYDEFYTMVYKAPNKEVHYNLFDMCVNSGYGNYKTLLKYLKEKNLLDFPAGVYEYRKNYYNGCEGKKDNINGWNNRLSHIKKYFENQRKK